MKKLLNILFIAILLYSCTNHQHTLKNKVTVFAAMGTSSLTTEICDSFTSQYKIAIENNYASSGTLAYQIINGAQTDIFISANKQWIDYLSANNVIIDSTITPFASNKLVIIVPKGSEINFKFNPDFKIEKTVKAKIAIGDPDYVPVGKYAYQFLDSLKWKNKLNDKMILAKDVSAVLHYVEIGEADWGIAYLTEAIKSKNVTIASIIPKNLHEPITFYMVLTKIHNADAPRLFKYFTCTEGKRILQKHGFIVE